MKTSLLTALSTMPHSFLPVPFFITILLACIASPGVLVAEVSAVPTLTAVLDYGTFQGAYSSAYNISYWMKIPYAAPPVGENRFRAPQPPIPISDGAYDSSQSFDFCPQRNASGTEDCLYLGLYSRPWSPPQPLRPVVLNFYGGGFIEGGGSFTIPPVGYPVLNISSRTDFIFVQPNYRVNAFGFLPGKQVAADPTSDLNVGLLDQQAALQWTQKYIQHFGGDPTNVGIWGHSAGGGSVVAQAIGNGRPSSQPLFTKALALSPYWPKTYRYDAPEAQSIYDTFASRAGCSGDNSLACLKAADVETLSLAALHISRSHIYTTSSFTWAPVIGDSFLPQPLSLASLGRNMSIDFGFGMYNSFEGMEFIPPGLNVVPSDSNSPFNSSLASFQSWLRGFLPGFSDRNIHLVEHMYPASGTAEVTGSYNSSYLRAQFIYRDLLFACPSYWLSSAAHRAGYLGQYAIHPALHTSGTSFWHSVNTEIQRENDLTYMGYIGAFASFFETGDPNAQKLTNASTLGVPDISLTHEEWVVLPKGDFENVLLGNDTLGPRCDFWRDMAAAVPV